MGISLDFAPTYEIVASGCVGIDFGRREEEAVERAVGDGLVGEGEGGVGEIGAQPDGLCFGRRQLEGRICLEVVEQLDLTLS